MKKMAFALSIVFVLCITMLANRADEYRDEKEAVVSVKQLPPAVKKAVLKRTKGTKIDAIEREKEDGRIVFEVEASYKGVEFELTFDQRGALVDFAVDDDEDDGNDESKEEVGDKETQAEPNGEILPLNKVPVAAREALIVQAGSAKIDEVVVQDHDGAKVYEAAWESEGIVREALVTASGDVVVLEEEIAANAAPRPVRQTAGKAFPKGAKLRFEKRTVILYEVEAEIDGKESHIIVAPTGQRFDEEKSGEGRQ